MAEKISEKKPKKVKKIKKAEDIGTETVRVNVVARTPIADKPRKSFNPETCLLMFTIEGQETWRTSLYSKKEDHEAYLAKAQNHPKITKMKWFVVNRVTGTVTEEK